MVSYGFAGHLGIGKETTWGTAVAATDYFEAMSESFALNIDRFDVRNIFGAYYEPDDATGLQRIEGDISLAGHPESAGHFLFGGLGVHSMTVVLSGFLFTNEFTARQSDVSTVTPLQPYTIEVFRDVTSSQQYRGCVLSQLVMNVAVNQDLRVTASWIGRDTANIAASTPTFPGSPTLPFTFDTCSVSVGGGASAQFESLTFTINNQLEGIGTLQGSSSLGRIKRQGPPMVAVDGTISFEDITEYQNFVNQTEQRLFANFTKQDSFSLLLDAPRLVYTAYPLGMPGRERQVVEFSGKAFYHTGSGNAFKATLTTVKSDYS